MKNKHGCGHDTNRAQPASNEKQTHHSNHGTSVEVPVLCGLIRSDCGLDGMRKRLEKPVFGDYLMEQGEETIIHHQRHADDPFLTSASLDKCKSPINPLPQHTPDARGMFITTISYTHSTTCFTKLAKLLSGSITSHSNHYHCPSKARRHKEDNEQLGFIACAINPCCFAYTQHHPGCSCHNS